MTQHAVTGDRAASPRRYATAGLLVVLVLTSLWILGSRCAVGARAASATADERTTANFRRPEERGIGLRVLLTASATPTAAPAVDWPELPDLAARRPLTTTRHFQVYAANERDPLLVRAVHQWTPELEALLAGVSQRLGLSLPHRWVHVVFSRTYDARCPARGLTSAAREQPLLLVYLDEKTPALQVRAVLAHEMVHHLTARSSFVGDAVLTEGIANWAASRWVLPWQGHANWQQPVLEYLRRGVYVPVSSPLGLAPGPGEDCLARRDRVYNVRAAFVEWLVGQIGLETVLAMPYVEVPSAATDRAGPPAMERRPDYVRATGYDLRTLELVWLTSLWLKSR